MFTDTVALPVGPTVRDEMLLTGTYLMLVCDYLMEVVKVAWRCQTPRSPSSAGAHPLKAGS